MAGPYGLDRELDNTPRWVQDTGGPGTGAWCDPFGYESDVRVLGGTHDAKHERHVWYCRNRADGRYRMTCVNGHSGTVRLCYAHVQMITRRMSGLCPACAFPPRFRDLDETCQRLTAEWFGMLPGRQRAEVGRRLEELREMMTEMYQRGEIRTGAPLTLTEVS
jgi:hypothetical protein